VNGLVLSENAATPLIASAKVLDNWIPTTTGIRVRGGAVLHATLDDEVQRIFSYRSGLVEKLFAATDTDVFDVTSPADPAVTPAASVTGQTSGYYSVAQFGTAGGNYLYLCNGDDDPQLYDGSTFSAINDASSPVAITGVTASNLSYVWAFASRLFFVEKNTMKAYYLPVDSIGGAAGTFSLAGIFRKGGHLLFGATWSQDSGDGLDDKCVFVSSEGEVAVYQGTDPGNASAWSKVGVYAMPKPLGPNGHVQVGGDLLIATEVGLIPISAAVRNDEAELSKYAVSSRIAPAWQSKAASLTSRNWEMVKDPDQNYMIVSQPGDVKKTSWVVNMQTQAWARWTGLDVRCLGFFNTNPYFGSANGEICLANSGGSDNGTPYTCRFLGQFDPLGAYGATKTVTQAKTTFLSGTPFIAQVEFRSDFDETASAPPSSVANFEQDTWGSGRWGVAIWDSAKVAKNSAAWRSIGQTGTYLAPDLQITFGVTPTPVVELVSIDAQYHTGADVT
jgi:hypothetical protein